LGVAAAVTGAVFSALAYVAVRRASRTNGTMVIVFYFALFSTVGAVPFAVPVWEWPTAWEWLVLVAVGVVT
ncbi:MAG: EamA/RhaT family transporter, partial [Gemmatimonadetes bacterium]|nr:EamA/RhaT family transporter [Gemmatimonadota bacterium]NIR76865.1 EamA/RhaT family transporter [Gemmatimonadota bacterium]NIT85387.1 EamA/RhaT family transporter [Gemmatimonadota bacterium]NIU29205.1 EamA/RhaT family transporter [Gemmatimonadota bacterium]NIU34302.1 EamA/RhaT family transporter [Gemmatimonadota bacterium]